MNKQTTVKNTPPPPRIVRLIPLLFILAITACGNGSTETFSGPPTKGRLTLTGLEGYDGKYVVAMTLKEGALAAGDFIAADDILENSLAGGKVSGGKIALKIWRMAGPETPESFSGPASGKVLLVAICKDRIFTWDNNDQVEKQGQAVIAIYDGVGSGAVTDIKAVP